MAMRTGNWNSMMESDDRTSGRDYRESAEYQQFYEKYLHDTFTRDILNYGSVSGRAL